MYWPAMHADRGSERLRPPPAHVSVATGGLVRENLRSDRRDFRDVRVEPRPERVRVTGSLRTLAGPCQPPSLMDLGRVFGLPRVVSVPFIISVPSVLRACTHTSDENIYL